MKLIKLDRSMKIKNTYYIYALKYNDITYVSSGFNGYLRYEPREYITYFATAIQQPLGIIKS